MGIEGTNQKSFRPRRKTRVAAVRKTKSGKRKLIRLFVNKHRLDSAPRQICIKCLTAHIRKNDLNYESKICKKCATTTT